MSTWDDTTDTGEYSVEDDNQLQPEDTLVDRGVDDILDEGISPPERPVARTNLDHPPGKESLDELLAEEEPDPISRIGNVLDELNGVQPDELEYPEDDEVGRRRSGRLVAPDEASARTTNPSSSPKTSVSTAGGRSAEEAAMHVIEDED